MKSATILFLAFLMSTINLTAQDQTRQRDRIHQEDHLRLLDGKLYLYKQGNPVAVKEQLTLKNGIKIDPNGSYQLQNQQRYQLRDGECLDMAGNRYLNQSRFNRRAMMTQKQIEQARTKAVNRQGQGNRGTAGRRQGRN